MKRIFLIGNGPSLAVTPLDDLIGEDTFAVNRIHMIYPKVKWRPKFFSYLDYASQNPAWREPIDNNIGIAEHMWLLKDYRFGLPKGHPNYEDMPPERAVGDIPNTTWIPRCEKHRMYSASHPDGMHEWHFPEICTVYNGLSPVIQIVAQMGCYDEIYLLGCDLGWQWDITKNHFDPDYNKDYMPSTEMERGYWIKSDQYNAEHIHRVAKTECDKRGIKVYNATIGGQLEVYPRRNLSEVLSGK